MSDDNGQCFSNDTAAERSDGRSVIATVSQTPIDDNGQCFSNDTAAERSDGLVSLPQSLKHQSMMSCIARYVMLSVAAIWA